MKIEIDVEYSCNLCGLDSVHVKVEERGAEDLESWMNKLIRIIAKDHRVRSPRCIAQKISRVKIPFHGGRVGEPRKN